MNKSTNQLPVINEDEVIELEKVSGEVSSYRIAVDSFRYVSLQGYHGGGDVGDFEGNPDGNDVANFEGNPDGGHYTAQGNVAAMVEFYKTKLAFVPDCALSSADLLSNRKLAFAK